MLTNGQLDLTSAKEDVAIAGTTDIASFTDSNLSDTASSFTASIDWGDGTTTTGTVVGSNGHFTVEGGHTYDDEGFPTAIVTVTRTADSSTLTMLGTVSISDTDTINPHGQTITYTPNTPLTNVVVATFTDPTNTTTPASDFVAQIDWGDGTTTSGTVQGSAGSFSVVGSHTYTVAGDFSISVSMNDNFPDAASGFVTSTAVSGFGAQVTLNSATEGTPLNGAEVATFADTTGSHVASDYTATIDWGDGATTGGTVSGSGQSFTVSGSHTYADELGVGGGSPDAKVTITRTADNTTVTAAGEVVVADADFLTMSSKTIGGSVNQPLSGVTVATFSDSYLGQVASDLEATINWGDGSDVETGTLSGGSGSFTVTGSHTYTSNGQDGITVTILEDLPAGETAIGSTLSKAIIGLAPGDFLFNNVLEGSSTSHNIATFNDGNTSDTAADFTASVDWGDGTTTSGTISGGSGAFTVSGVHAYADEGTEPVAVTVTRTADGETATITGDTAVGDADSFVVTADNFNGDPGTALNNVQVATFSDTFIGQVASDLDATINWGDGTTSAGTVSGGSGSFTVLGSHTYATGGNYTFNVSVADDPPGIAAANANGTATINLAGQIVLTSATEGTAVPNGTPVATFSDSNGGDTAASFTATIEWGDGTTSAGTVSGGGGTFTVSGGHTYADEGNFGASAVLTRTSDQVNSTASGAVAVAEADVLVPHGTTFTANAHQIFAGTVATFDDTGYPGNDAGDFTASIDWGDGTTTTGTVSGGSGSAFTVSGSHAYAASGMDTVTVTLRDDAPGTATATAITSATVNPGAAIRYDFSGDGLSDLLFQNQTFGADPNNGTPQIWLWNGTAITTKATLQTPTANFLIVGSGDFNSDGHADILWQNTDGTPAIWLMNGTTLIGAATLPKPTAGFEIVATGDFNDDGHADILWQNTDGTPAIWEMNGTTIIGAATLPKPTAGFKVVATGDVNADGHDDILWQNTDGTPAIWEMNGTTIIGAATLPNPGSAWKLIGSGDFDQNGTGDLLFQNADGTPMIWQMNGTNVVAQLTLSNPGGTWRLDPTNPLAPSAQNSASAAAGPTVPDGAAMHQSAPDMANAAPPSGFTGFSSNPLNSPAEQTFLGHLFTGVG